MSRWMKVVAAVAVSAAAGRALAHDFWMQLSAYRVSPNQIVKVGLHVGDVYPGDSFPRSSARFDKFVAVGSGGEMPIVGREGQDPAGLIRFDKADEYVLGYRSKPSYVELPAEKFEHYLKEKGLEKVIEQRAAAGQSQAAGREMFSRCAKAIVRVGPGTDGAKGFERELGMRLELVPEVDPLALKAGDELVVRLEYEGEPCAGVVVTGMNVPLGSAVMAPEKVIAKTDEQGRARLKVAGSGLWVVNAVEMAPAPKGEAKADWESLWASLSFEVAE